MKGRSWTYLSCGIAILLLCPNAGAGDPPPQQSTIFSQQELNSVANQGWMNPGEQKNVLEIPIQEAPPPPEGAYTNGSKAVPSSRKEVALKGEMKLKDIVDLALQLNPGLAAAERGINVAERGRKVAWSENLPKAFVESGYHYSPLNKKLILPMHQFVPSPQNPNALRIVASEFDRSIGNYGFRITLPIFTGGRIQAQTQLADFAIQLSQQRFLQTRDDLVFNLSSTYYTLLRLREDIAATEANLKRLEESQRVVNQQFQVGRAAQVDVFKINTRLAEVQQALIRVRNALEVARGVLNTLIGLEVTEKVNIVDTLSAQPQTYSLDESLREAMERRPEIKAKEREVAIQGQNIRIALANRLPQGNLNSDYGWWDVGRKFGDDSSPAPDINIFVSLSLPIFDEVLRQKYLQEKVKLAQVEKELEDLRLKVSLEVETAYLNIGEAAERIRAAEAALREANETLRIEEMKVQVGRATIEFLLDAQAAQLRSQENYFAALADYNIQTVALRKAIGLVEVQ